MGESHKKEGQQVRLWVINVSFLLLSFSQFALIEDTNIIFICFLSWAWAHNHGQQGALHQKTKQGEYEHKQKEQPQQQGKQTHSCYIIW